MNELIKSISSTRTIGTTRKAPCIPGLYRTHKKERDEYAQIKNPCTKFSYDIDRYCGGKRGFCAKKWKNKRLSQYDGYGTNYILLQGKYSTKGNLPTLLEVGSVSVALYRKGRHLRRCLYGCHLLFENVCRKKCDSKYDYKWRKSNCENSCSDVGLKVGMPCRTCQKFSCSWIKMPKIEILCDYATKKVIQLRKAIPKIGSVQQKFGREDDGEFITISFQFR